MKRVLVLAEGLTEERFVKSILNPHLLQMEKTVVPTLITTKRVKSGPDFKGGVTHYKKIERDLRRLLGDSSAVAVTSFIDYYGLPGDFPGYKTRPAGTPIMQTQHVEREWAKKIANPRFRPYLMLHEFEALLFVEPAEVCTTLHQLDALPKVREVRATFPTPEDINDDPHTAPSKRLAKLLVGYRKAVHGPIVTGRVGLPGLRGCLPALQ